ncbi:C-5 cytosine-specific DNA methylase [Xylanimonas cellulosilytica DSM 15894]|uniref:DNA (cytosine-5-)-methyltransferase n=1 Tax=Xylanimonas cellulosilytica (strain DSM 15894 / JCM 12276 / CECT 5975 / KCTC 9989 / LMG 20990 / NBRC 107835 / XIL07) TaxID=446471 RepID=D1BWM5_XYLCX|nr:DNA cytosine methyltransferase [Xylanimonas cellulosilytica]ACZ29607.1 C-5 cytosine-specific DNA methylase [Xylanimonas cellulosilytica DSM 15894]
MSADPIVTTGRDELGPYETWTLPGGELTRTAVPDSGANLTLTDLFCGAGGSSTGAVSVPGVQVRLAANHWDKAIETHNTNHPDVDHLQADISQTDPRYVPRTDMLWASPECTNHSRAKGRKAAAIQPDLFGDVLPDAAAERSRATMWDVVRFTEAHDYRAVLVENVVEVVDWASPTGIRGGLFQAWLTAMHSMGYRHRIISLNSMHAAAMRAPAPQSRDRVYIAFTKEGERAPDFERMQRPKAWCPRCETVVEAMQWWKRGNGQTRPGRYRSQYLYRCPNTACRNEVVEPYWLPASSIIDWSNPGQRIGDRAKPLADKTMRRIQVGIERYWSPLLVEHGGNPYDAADPKHPGYGDPGSYYRAWPIADPTQTMHTRESKALAWHPLAVPVEGRDGKVATSTGRAMRAQTTRNETGLAFPPFLAELRGGGSTARLASDALATVTASGNHHALIHRNNHGGAEMTTPASEPIRTITTAGHQSVLQADRPTIDVDDVRFRMLEPDEIKQAMAFPGEYVMVGNRREQVRLAGNAVTPPAARDLISAVVAAITREDVAA